MTNYGETKKRYRKLEFLQEGEYEGVITEVASSQTRDGATKFLNVYISTKCGKADTILQKSFVKNAGRNFELVTFLQDAGVLEDNGQSISNGGKSDEKGKNENHQHTIRWS